MNGEQRLSDYKVPEHLVSHTNLIIFLDKTPIKTQSKLTIIPNDLLQNPSTELQLDCENMEINKIKLNDKVLVTNEYEYQPEKKKLIIKNVPKEPFTIETLQTLHTNTDLFGLYQTGDITLIKAETFGMRRVIPCIDRPDVSSKYITKIVASDKIPTLLANGRLTDRKKGGDRNSVTWTTDHAFPTYLYAMVAGNLECFTESYTVNEATQRTIDLKFYLPPSQKSEYSFAAKALTQAMTWDKANFDFEYPLNEYKIAGVDQYASGASETFGFNLFNLANLLGTTKNRTDVDILRIYRVVAHKYFHMLSGNMVTLRNWFNLPLKEGLTMFRESMFFESLFGTDRTRLFHNNVFDERAPRPDSYVNVRSLYNAASYDKSAEIFRMMMRSLPGSPTEQMANFFKALQQFFNDNLGNAVTLETLIDSVSKSTDKDVSAFLHWFTKSGVPTVTVHTKAKIVRSSHDVEITFDVEGAKDRPIPMAYALFNSQGQKIKEETVILNDGEYKINVTTDCIPGLSLLRNLSAPVRVKYDCLEGQLINLIQHDDDLYNRVNAVQKLFASIIETYCYHHSLEISSELIAAYRNLLKNSDNNPWELVHLLSIPSEEVLFIQLPTLDLKQIVKAREDIQRKLATSLKTELTELLEICSSKVKSKENCLEFDYHAAGQRQLRTLCQTYLLSIIPEMEHVLLTQFHHALGYNMTDALFSLTLLVNNHYKDTEKLLACCYEAWKDNPNAINYWLNLQASMHTETVIQQVKMLMNHTAFQINNPNNVNALIGSFIKNPYGFHKKSGEGYKLVVDFILELELINPSLAANLTSKFNNWEQYSKECQLLILSCLDELGAKAVTNEVKSMLNMVKKGEENMGKRKHGMRDEPKKNLVNELPDTRITATQNVQNNEPEGAQTVSDNEPIKGPGNLSVFSGQTHKDPVLAVFAAKMAKSSPF